MRRLLILLLAAFPAFSAEYLVLAGTYTRTTSRGIYSFRFDTTSGKVRGLSLAAEASNPSFLAVSPNAQYIFAVNEDNPGTVTSFALDVRTGKLREISRVSSGGGQPLHLAIDRTGRWLITANYANGAITVIPVAPDGTLSDGKSETHTGSSVHPRQRGPHAHDVVFAPDNRHVLVADLGLDKIFVYSFDAATGALTPATPPSVSVAPGAGVRHMVFHPNGKVLYAINELNSTINAFQWDNASGRLESFQTISTLPESFQGTSTTAEIQINKAGTVVYGSNRGHDSIAIFPINPQNDRLLTPTHALTLGRSPRFFALDPTGAYLFAANQETNNIVMFKVHAGSGQLTPHGEVITGIPIPVCLVFVPAPQR